MVREEYEVREVNASPNILYFGHNDNCEDCIDINYTIRSESYSSPDEEGKYFDVDFKRKSEEEIDRMINSTYHDGYFIGDDLRDYNMYRIKGVVKDNICYYYSEEIMFEEVPYRTVHAYNETAGVVTVDHYHSYWRFLLYMWVLIFIIWTALWAVKDTFFSMMVAP